MKNSKIDTIRMNLENTMELTAKEIERLEEYEDETYYTIKDLENELEDLRYPDIPYYNDEYPRKHMREIENELEEQRELHSTIIDELMNLRKALRNIDKALDAMDEI